MIDEKTKGNDSIRFLSDWVDSTVKLLPDKHPWPGYDKHHYLLCRPGETPRNAGTVHTIKRPMYSAEVQENQIDYFTALHGLSKEETNTLRISEYIEIT